MPYDSGTGEPLYDEDFEPGFYILCNGCHTWVLDDEECVCLQGAIEGIPDGQIYPEFDPAFGEREDR